MNPEDLIPKLPKPKDLKPFPTTLSLVSFKFSNVKLLFLFLCAYIVF